MSGVIDKRGCVPLVRRPRRTSLPGAARTGHLIRFERRSLSYPVPCRCLRKAKTPKGFAFQKVRCLRRTKKSKGFAFQNLRPHSGFNEIRKAKPFVPSLSSFASFLFFLSEPE
jgi:hypothetical protein